MDIIFVADFFADQILGGGELNNEELINRGGFGSPTFFYRDKMFFGNDRLHLLEESITRNLI